MTEPSAIAGSGTQPRNGMGIAALVLGIVGLLLSWIPFVWVASILAIVFGAIGAKRAKAGQATNRGMALWGMWLGIAAVILWFLIAFLFGIALFGASMSGEM